MKMNSLRMSPLLRGLAMAGVAGAAVCAWGAGSGSCFLKPGDRWAMEGDSITHNDIYRQKVERVFRHFHPDVPVAFSQAGPAQGMGLRDGSLPAALAGYRLVSLDRLLPDGGLGNICKIVGEIRRQLHIHAREFIEVFLRNVPRQMRLDEPNS